MSKRLAFMLAVALGGCAGGSGSVGVQYASGVTVRSPELVTVDGYEDVDVVADADEPVFYSDDYYWLYRGDRWYRSRSYDRDFVYVREPAPRVRRIHQPTAYIRYRSRHQEARNVPRPAPAPRDPWRDQYDRSDVPSTTLPPQQQQRPYEPVRPQQPATPYPRPPQQESPTRVEVIEPPHPVTPATPPARDVRATPPGHDNRPATPPGHDNRPATPPGHDRVKPQPPAGGTHVTPPGPPANHDVRRDDNRRPEDRRDNAREEHPPKAPPGQVDRDHDRGRDEDRRGNDKRRDEKSDKKDKKRDY